MVLATAGRIPSSVAAGPVYHDCWYTVKLVKGWHGLCANSIRSNIHRLKAPWLRTSHLCINLFFFLFYYMWEGVFWLFLQVTTRLKIRIHSGIVLLAVTRKTTLNCITVLTTPCHLVLGVGSSSPSSSGRTVGKFGALYPPRSFEEVPRSASRIEEKRQLHSAALCYLT